MRATFNGSFSAALSISSTVPVIATIRLSRALRNNSPTISFEFPARTETSGLLSSHTTPVTGIALNAKGRLSDALIVLNCAQTGSMKLLWNAIPQRKERL